MSLTHLTALPVFNEVNSVDEVLDSVTSRCNFVLVVDDGSTDGTSERLAERAKTKKDIFLVRHPKNKGYGAALVTAFNYGIENNYDIIVTIDCDGQHEPQRINEFVKASKNSGADIVSGSRYLKTFDTDTAPPAERRKINMAVTDMINERLGYDLTDAFCGFKAYRAEALKKLEITESGYAMPLELWVQAACKKLTVIEQAVPLIYLDESRSFGGVLDDGETRLKYYTEVLNRAFAKLPSDCEKLKSQRVG